MKNTTNSATANTTIKYSSRKSIVHVSIDIGRVLADREGITFRVQGTCMFPTLRPGDLLNIKPRSASDVRIGDIAVFRTPQYLISHRVFSKGEDKGRTSIVTRPDCFQDGNDGPTYDEDILGVVSAIKRNGKEVSLQSKNYPLFIRWYYKKYLALIEFKERLKLWLAGLFIYFDKSFIFRAGIHGWFLINRPRLTYIVQVPLNDTLGDAVYNRLDPDKFKPESELNGRKINFWKLALYLKDDSEPGAWVSFTRDSKGLWKVRGSHTRIRYRGAGLEGLLMAEAEKILPGVLNDRHN